MTARQLAVIAEGQKEQLQAKDGLGAIPVAQTTTPTATAAGVVLFYPKADGGFYTLNSSGTETKL